MRDLWEALKLRLNKLNKYGVPGNPAVQNYNEIVNNKELIVQIDF